MPPAERQRIAATVIGVAGGLAITGWAVDYFRALEPEEAKPFVRLAAGAAAALAVWYAFDLDERWVNAEKAMAWAEQAAAEHMQGASP